MVYLVNTPTGLFNQAYTPECNCQSRVAGFWFVNEDILDGHTFRETAWVGNENMVMLPLDIHGIHPVIITMQQALFNASRNPVGE